MNGKYFLDTNIIIYSFDHSSFQKKSLAEDLIVNGITKGNAVISYQVIQEFSNVAMKKFRIPLKIADCKKYIHKILLPLLEVHSSIQLLDSAFDVMERWQFGFYDSLIIASALQANCSVLFSEDLQHNQKIYSMEIRNPFL